MDFDLEYLLDWYNRYAFDWKTQTLLTSIIPIAVVTAIIVVNEVGR